MADLEGYSGKYNADLKAEDFSKAALVRLCRAMAKNRQEMEIGRAHV